MSRRERQTPTQPNTGFKVVPEGADIAHRFLKTIDTALELPIQMLRGEELELSLGEIDVHNTLVHFVLPRLVYIPEGYYKIITSIVPATKAPEELDTPRSNRSPESSPLENLFKSFGAVEVGAEIPIALPILANTLRVRPQLAGYDIQLDSDSTEISVNPPEPQIGEVQDSSYLIQAAGEGYYLGSLKSQIEADPKDFETKYRFYARLLEEVVLSLYQANHTQSPNAILNFAPPEDTATRLRRMEKLLSVNKRRLSAAGLLDDGDDEDIEKKVVMERPNIRFTDVGGQDKAKTELNDIVTGLEDPLAFYSEGAAPPNGALLYGPSGTGKTLLARATAGEAEATIFSVGLASILHSLWGKTERYIQRIFDKAAEQAPAIIFFDEIDAIARQRSSLNQAYSSIVNVLVTNMDGMQERAQGVVVIGATNLLELVDYALLRPGRFDMLIPVELPDDQARAQIFEIHKRKALGRPNSFI